MPGLSLFDDVEENPGLWEGIKKLFTGPAVAQRPEREDDDDYEDYSGAGWEGNGDDIDDVDDMVENIVILAVTGLIMLLFWLRQRWGQIGFAGLQQPGRMVA